MVPQWCLLMHKVKSSPNDGRQHEWLSGLWHSLQPTISPSSYSLSTPKPLVHLGFCVHGLFCLKYSSLKVFAWLTCSDLWWNITSSSGPPPLILSLVLFYLFFLDSTDLIGGYMLIYWFTASFAQYNLKVHGDRVSLCSFLYPQPWQRVG